VEWEAGVDGLAAGAGFGFGGAGGSGDGAAGDVLVADALVVAQGGGVGEEGLVGVADGFAGVVEHGVLSPFRGALMVKRKWPQRVDARCSHFFALTSILPGWVKLTGHLGEVLST